MNYNLECSNMYRRLRNKRTTLKKRLQNRAHIQKAHLENQFTAEMGLAKNYIQFAIPMHESLVQNLSRY